MLVQAIETKDFPVLQCGIVVVATLFILINMVVELVYGILDPRIAAKR
jgi:peptide/nickel transport system permease protein